MAARSHWDGLSVRRGSLDSNTSKKFDKKVGVIPFKCSVHPRHITQNMENKLSSSASNSCHQSPLRTAGMLPDHYKELEHLRKENFNLKLRIYLLEKEMVARNPNEEDQQNIQFDMELENEIKDKMLDEALRTSKINEAKFVKAEKQIKELMSAKEKLEAQLNELRSAFYKKDMDVQELRHVVQDKDHEIQSLKENKHKLKFVIQQLVVELNKNSADKKGDKLLNSNLGVQSPKSKMDEKKSPSPSRNVEAGSPALNEDMSQLEFLQNDNLQKQDTINQLNTAMESLVKTNEKLSSELEEKTKLVKDLQESLQEMAEQFRNFKRDLCETNTKYLSSKCEHKKPSLMMNEAVQTVCMDDSAVLNHEEKETVISSLQERILELNSHIQDLNHQKSTIFKQHNVLQEHLEKLAHFMADLIDSRLSITGDSHAASQFLSAVSKCIESTMELSHSFLQDVSSLNMCDFTLLDEPSFAPDSNSNFESTRHSVFLRPSSPKNENVNEVENKDISEGTLSNSTLSSVKNERNKSQASRRRTSLSSQRIPAVNLEHRFQEVYGVQGHDDRNSLISKAETSLSDGKNESCSYLPTDTVQNTRTCWELPNELPNESANVSQLGVDIIAEPDHDAVIHVRVSSDSDIWSEPDREVSLQRVGIEMKKPVPPLQQKRGSRTRWTEDVSSDTLSEGGNNNRRKQHLGHLIHDVRPKIVELQQQLSECKRHHQFAQEKLEALLREKQFLNQRLIESEEKNHSLKELLQKLNYEKTLYEQENLQNKANFTTVENLCNDLQAQLHSTKEKLKELYERCHQYEEEVTNLKTENKFLLEKNQSLHNIIKLQACNDSELPSESTYVNAFHKQDSEHMDKLQIGDTSGVFTVNQLDGNISCSETSLRSQQNVSSNVITENMNDYLEQGKLSHHLFENNMTEIKETFNKSVLIDHLVKLTKEKSFEIESKAAKEDSQVLLLKNTISEQKQKFHKAIWKKDFLLVTKTVLNQRLTAEVEEKNKIIKSLQAEVDHKEKTIVTLQKQLNILEEEKELLESEKVELFNRISTYTSETRDIQAQLLELKKQVQEREFSQEDTEKEVEDLKYHLQVKDAKISCLKNGCGEVKVHKFESVKNKKMSTQAAQTEQVHDSVIGIDEQACLSGEIQHLNSQLYKTKEMLHKKETLCRNLHIQVQDLQQKVRDLKHYSVHHETSFQDQNDTKNSYMPKVNSSFQISGEETAFKSIPSNEHEIKNVCQIIVEREEFEEKVATITKLQKQISELESKLQFAEQESRIIKEQNTNLLQQLKDQHLMIKNHAGESKAIQTQLSNLKETKTHVNVPESEIENKIPQLQQELAEKELFVANLSRDRQHMYDSLVLSSNHFRQELQRKDDLIDQLEVRIKEKSELLYQLKKTLQEKARLIDQQASELEQSSNITSKLQEELFGSSKLVEKLSSELKIKSCLIGRLCKLKSEIKSYDCDVGNKVCVHEVNKEHEKSSYDEIQLIDQNKEHISEFEHVNKKLQECSDLRISQKQSSELCSPTYCNDTTAETVLHMSSEELEAADVIEYITIMLEHKQQEQALRRQVEECHKELKSLEFQCKSLQDQNISLQEKLNNNNLFVQKVVEDSKFAKTKLSEFEKQMKCNEEAEAELKIRISELLDELSSKDTCITSLTQEKQNLQFLINQYENHVKEMELNVKNATDDLTIMQNNLKEKSCHIEELNNEVTAKSNLVSQLELNSREKSDFISELQSQLDDKIKCFDQQCLDLREKSDCTSKLHEELATLHSLVNQLKSDLDSKTACINKLNSDLSHKTEISVQLEEELRHKVDLIDKYKDNNMSKSKLIAGLKESLEGRNEMVKQLGKELDLKSVTIAELKNQVNQKNLECEEVYKKLVTTEDLVNEKKKMINGLEGKVTELQSVLFSKVPVKGNTAQSNCDKGIQHSNHSPEEKENQLLSGTKLEKVEASSIQKLSLQKSILQLQLKFFKNTAFPLQQHFAFVDRIATLYSTVVSHCHSSNNSNVTAKVEEKQFLHSLEADVEFFKNIRYFLKYVVLPSMKYETSVSIRSPTNTKDTMFLHETEPWDKSDEEIASLLSATKTVRNGLTSFNAMHVESVYKQHEDGDGTLIPVYMETSDHDSRIEFEQGLTTAGCDQPAYEFLEPINSRSKYSSPDLGIESDPNQDPVVHKPIDRDDFSSMNKDSLVSQLCFNQEETWANASHICVLGVLKDFELLRKEVEECIVGMKAISSRATEGLKTFGKSTSPRKMLECSTLKGVLDSCKNVEMCLHQAEKLINNFWFGSYPKHEDRAFDVVFKENQTLKQKIKDLADELKQMKSALKESEKKAEAKARSISKQLVETKRVLRKAKANFEQKLGSAVQ